MNKHAANLSFKVSLRSTKAGPAKHPNRGFGGVGGFLFPKIYKHTIYTNYIHNEEHCTLLTLCMFL